MPVSLPLRLYENEPPVADCHVQNFLYTTSYCSRRSVRLRYTGRSLAVLSGQGECSFCGFLKTPSGWSCGDPARDYSGSPSTCLVARHFRVLHNWIVASRRHCARPCILGLSAKLRFHFQEYRTKPGNRVQACIQFPHSLCRLFAILSLPDHRVAVCDSVFSYSWDDNFYDKSSSGGDNNPCLGKRNSNYSHYFDSRSDHRKFARATTVNSGGPYFPIYL